MWLPGGTKPPFSSLLHVSSEAQTFKRVGVFYLHCPFLWVREETIGPRKRKMPVSASLVALIRDENLPSLPFKDLLFLMDLLGPDPKKTIPFGTVIRDLITHHTSYITDYTMFSGKEALHLLLSYFKPLSLLSKTCFQNILCTKGRYYNYSHISVAPFSLCWKLATRQFDIQKSHHPDVMLIWPLPWEKSNPSFKCKKNSI